MLNEVINCPHIYLNRVNKLPKHTSENMKKGQLAHDYLNDHFTGKTINKLLSDVPPLPIVERQSFDKQIEIRVSYSNKYDLVCFVDARSQDWSTVADFKSGKRWTTGDFSRLEQWKLYCWANPLIKKFYLINVPFDPKDWNKENVMIYNTDVTDKDRQKGKEFIEKGIKIIENIADQVLNYEGHHPYCWYPDCTFCTEPIPAYRL